MNPLREWAQHNLIRALASAKNVEVSQKIFPEIRKKWFVSKRYKRVFSLIKEEYLKNGTFLTWNSLINNPSLSADDSKYLRTKEIKRKSNEVDDVSLRIPRTEEDYQGLISRMKFDSRHMSIINMHNKMATALDNDDLTPEELDAIIANIKGETIKAAEDTNIKGEHVELTVDNLRPIMKKAYKEYKQKFFIPTGFKAFDSVNIGIPTSALFVIMGKTGSGKSSLALNIGMNSKQLGARVCFVPLEMTINEMIIKMGSRLLKEPVNDLMQNMKRSFKRIIKAVNGFLTPEDEETDTSCFHFYVPEDTDTMEDVLTFLEPYNYDMIIVDYPKLLSTGGLPEFEALDKAAKFSKKFSTRNLTYILWIAQMDDTTEAIRYSRAVMEHASNAWIISGDIDENRESGQVLIKQRKARGQSPHSFNLNCDLSYSYYGDYEEESIGEEVSSKKRKKKSDDEIDEEDIKTTKEIQDKTRAKRSKGKVKIKVGPGLDEMSANDDVFLDVPEE